MPRRRGVCLACKVAVIAILLSRRRKGLADSESTHAPGQAAWDATEGLMKPNPHPERERCSASLMRSSFHSRRILISWLLIGRSSCWARILISLYTSIGTATDLNFSVFICKSIRPCRTLSKWFGFTPGWPEVNVASIRNPQRYRLLHNFSDPSCVVRIHHTATQLIMHLHQGQFPCFV